MSLSHNISQRRKALKLSQEYVKEDLETMLGIFEKVVREVNADVCK